jgi:hypothetical protein
LPVAGSNLGESGHLAALGQREADQAGDDEQVDREQLEEGGEDAARRATFSLGAPSARCTMYWSVHQYHRPMTGAQMAMPSHGKLPLKYQACFTTWPAAFNSSTGAQVASTPAGVSGFQRLNMSEPQSAAQLVPAAQLVQAVEGQQAEPPDEDDDLHGVVVGHGAHAAEAV